MKTEYNGHRSWNAWNVSLWINNEESTYNWAFELMQKYNNAARVARIMMQDLRGSKTPDGAVYNHLAVKLAIQDINS